DGLVNKASVQGIVEEEKFQAYANRSESDNRNPAAKNLPAKKESMVLLGQFSFPSVSSRAARGLVKKPMDPVTKWFLSGLRDLSLSLEHPSLSGTRFYGRALTVRVETQGIDALV